MPPRRSVGLLAAALLISGGLVWVFASFENPMCGPLIRTGVVLAVFWMAMPTQTRRAAWANISPWALAGATAVLLLIARKPYVMIPIVVVTGIMAMVLRGPRRTAPRGREFHGSRPGNVTAPPQKVPARLEPPRGQDPAVRDGV